MKEIHLGTIGSGAIVHSILDNVSKTEGIRLCAVYSRSPEKGSALAEAYGAERIYTDLDAFLRDDAINFVYIASPNILHYAQAKAALLAGKHVILEKPFCTTHAQALELVELAKHRKRFLIDATPTAFLPNFCILQQLLPEIGPVRMVIGNYTQYSSRYDQLLQGEITNVFDPAYGGGALMDLNYYNVYLTTALFGRPESAVYFPNRHTNGIDTSGALVMDYPGFSAVCAAAKDCHGQSSYRIQGERGYIEIPGGSNGISEIRLFKENEETVFNNQPDPNRWAYEIRGLTALVQQDDYDTVYSNLDRMLDVIAILEDSRIRAGIRFPDDK